MPQVGKNNSEECLPVFMLPKQQLCTPVTEYNHQGSEYAALRDVNT